MKPARKTALAAVVLTILGAVLVSAFPLGYVDRLPRCLTNPLLAFETLHSPEEAALIWTQLKDPPVLRKSFLADYGFIAAYTFLFITLGRMARSRDIPFGRPVGTIAILTAIAAGASDALENLFALRVIGILQAGGPPAQAAVDLVRRFSLTKWGLLGVTLILLCMTFRPQRRGDALYRLTALLVSGLCAVSGIICVAGVWENSYLELALPFLVPTILIQIPLYLAYWPVLMNIGSHHEGYRPLEMWGQTSGGGI